VEIAATMKRFYKDVSVVPEGAGWRVMLDLRAVKTQGGRPQVLPTEGLAAALAAEWAAQGDEIDPALLVLRDLADYALDVIAPDRAGALAGLLRFAETDTLCYRAEPDEPFHARQLEVWEPLLKAAEARWDVHYERVSGVLHRPQPSATLQRLEGELSAQDDFALAALNTLTSLSASLVIGLTALEQGASVVALWHAAELEEVWQVEQWGSDAEAEVRQERRLAAFKAAARFARLVRG
jgi:chaperone required for assembly of F1-ATPase